MTDDALTPELAAISYRDIRPTDVRFRARSCALRLAYLASRFSGGIDRALSLPRVQFLYLHHLFADEIDSFRSLLETLSETHQIIPYGAAVSLLREDSPRKPYLTFSLDDGFKSNLTAARILSEFGIRACFFVSTDYVGLTDAVRKREVCRKIFHMPPVDFMDWRDLEELLDSGHEIGSHSADHSRLSRLPAEMAKKSIYDSREVLSGRLGEVSHFAWPYGGMSDIGESLLDFVREQGFLSAASATRGCHTARMLGNEVIWRDRVVAAEPVHEILYFMARNSRRASAGPGE